MPGMAVIRRQDLRKGADAFRQWRDEAVRVLADARAASGVTGAGGASVADVTDVTDVMNAADIADITDATGVDATGVMDTANVANVMVPERNGGAEGTGGDGGITATGHRGYAAGAAETADAQHAYSDLAFRLNLKPSLPRPTWAMAVRYSLYVLERRAPGEGVEVRVAPWGAIKILDGPASDPHNLTPPDVIELRPEVWLRLAAGITTWQEEKDAGRITAVGERDDLSDLLPLMI